MVVKELTNKQHFTGYFVGFILTITSYAFLASLMIFFMSSSWATKFRSEKKKSLEEDFKNGNPRDKLRNNAPKFFLN